MPTYEYRCNDCRHTFRVIEPISKHAGTRTACPKCRSSKTQQVLSASYVKTTRKS